MINDAMIRLYIEYMYTTITSTEDLKGCRNVTRKQFKKLKSLLSMIRVTRTKEEILNRGKKFYGKYKQEN